MRRRGWITAVLAGMLGTLLVAAPTPAGNAAESPVQQPAATYSVTLITGDRVTVAEQAGEWRLVRVEPARRLPANDGFLQRTGPDGITVLPRAAAPLVRSGRLDKELFDVTGLVKLGYDDARSTELPLLVSTTDARAVTALGRVTRELPAAGLTAVAAPKNRAAALFDAAVTARSAPRIWLNGKAFPTLDQSVPQVGAPQAWAAGHTGAGATIAVLDTGYDANHPDLAGVVTGVKDFVGSGMADEIGHGTHVAATAAGRGAASAGRYAGVAKGANLMVGKVCGPDGCPFDAIIAGMRWAAASGATVVNMSLGAGPTDGTDPVSTEVNRLSAEHGTLFVIAAGNLGMPGSVSTPAAADSALAVASVTKQDTMSDFSARGPRAGDFALKPDIAAPGQDIVAARAAGTLPDEAVDEHHARLSGTSMAAPHVAGAAAIIAAQHPDWNGERIKSALMSTAHPIEAGVYEQGAGRLDVARAVRQQITASPASLSLGYVTWPHDGPAPAPQQVTYRNTGTAPVTLALHLTTWDQAGQPAPAGMFSVDATSVTVPAGGEATATVTFDPKSGPTGLYGGRLVAQTGKDIAQTSLGGYKEPESYDLTLNMIDRNGTSLPAGSNAGVALIVSLDDPDHEYYWPVSSGQLLRLPAGRYSVMSLVDSPVAGEVLPSTTSVGEPEFVLDKNTTLNVDTKRGKRVTIRTDEKDARIAAGAIRIQMQEGDTNLGTIAELSEAADAYAVPTKQPRDHFAYYTRAQVERPVVRLTVDSPESFEVPVAWVPNSPRLTDSRALSAVDVGHATPEEIAARDLRGKLVVFTLGAGEEEEFDRRLKAIADAGAAAVLFSFSEQIRIGVGEVPAIPSAYTTRAPGQRLAELAASGAPAVTLSGIAYSPYRYELAFPHPGGVPATLDYRPRNHDLGAVNATYHASVDGGRAILDYVTTAAGDIDMIYGLSSTDIPVPARRTEYYSPGPVVWGLSVRVASHTDPTSDGYAQHGYLSGDRQYRRGEKVSVDWNKAVIGPGLAVSNEVFDGQPHLVYRDGDRIRALLPLLSDGARHSGLNALVEHNFPDMGYTALYAGETLVSRSEVPGQGTFEVPGAAADYRLVSDVTRTHPAWPLSTKVSAEWTFQSSHTDGPKPLPLLAIGFDPKLDEYNYAPAGKRFTFPVSVGRQPGADGGKTDLRTVEVSFDDGTTWQKVRPKKVGDHWEVTVTHPATGFVSLRASASDATGNTTRHTVIRAYRLK